MSSPRQDSVAEEVEPDTAPLSRKTRLNGGSSGPTSPPKRSKKTRQERLCESTVAADTTHVMRLFLVTRSKSLTEQDITVPSTPNKIETGALLRSESGGDDLETDAGPESQDSLSPDEAEEDREEVEATIKDIAERLGRIGDAANEKYEKNRGDGKTVNSLFASLFVANAYEAFKDGVEDICRVVCNGTDPDVDSLAFVFYLTQRFVEAAKDAGRHVEESAQFGERYIGERFGDWIERRGGWGRVLDRDGPGTAIN